MVLAGLLGLLPGVAARAQAPVEDSLASIEKQFGRYSRQTPIEQLYLHLDRPAYAAGETMWFSIAAVDGTYHRPLNLSKLAYVEVLDATNRPVLRSKAALEAGGGRGSFVLPAELASGRYTVRAYTSWMQNFSPEYYFHQDITIVNTFRSAGPSFTKTGAEAYDVQFFPEGGQLVKGLPGRVGFRVVDKAGRSRAATGTVTNSWGATVATFSTLRFGLGSFAFTPAEAGVAYSASVRLPDRTTLNVRLPAVQAQGYTLQLTDESPTTLKITVQTNVPGADGTAVHLLGHAGQQASVAATKLLRGGQAVFSVSRRELRPGISHFTIFTGTRQPVAERLYFERPRHPLALTVQSEKSAFGRREKVTLRVATLSTARASVAVYQLDSLSAPGPADIGGYLTLSADLKGVIENPDYYLRDSSAVGRAAADNLMLTQGWSRFRWSEVLTASPATPAFLPEINGQLLRVRLTDKATGAPVPDVSTYVTAPSRTGRFYQARTQANGLAQIELTNFRGLHELVVQTSSPRDSLYRLEILSPYSARFAAAPLAPPGISPQLTAPITERHIQVQVQKAGFGLLPLAGKLAAPDTSSFFGKPDERYVLDDFTRFKVMEEVLREYVPGVLVRKHKDGFHLMTLDRTGHKIFDNNPLVLLDGLPIFDMNRVLALDPLKIRQLDVLTRRYFQGSQSYEGVVSFTTYKGDLGGMTPPKNALLEEYEGTQTQREFFAPRYETSQQQQSRRPDLRGLLYWNPALQLAAGTAQTLDFYTSDQAGRYLVVVQGLGANGQPGTAKTVLEVKAPL